MACHKDNFNLKMEVDQQANDDQQSDSDHQEEPCAELGVQLKNELDMFEIEESLDEELIENQPALLQLIDHFHEPTDDLDPHQPADTVDPFAVVSQLKNDLNDIENQQEESIDIAAVQNQSSENLIEEEPTTSLQSEAATDIYKKNKNKRFIENTKDVQAMIIIVNNIIKSCKEEANEKIQFKNASILKLKEYTKESTRYIHQVLKGYKSERSLKQAIVDTRPLPKDVHFIYSDVRDIFIEYYLQRKQLPTIIDFLKSFHIKRDDSFYKHVKLRTLVKNNLVKYHHIPKLNRCILTENPEFGYKRNIYLRQIIKQRSSGRPIIYLSITTATVEKRQTIFAAAVSSTAGIIDKCYSNVLNDDDKRGNNEIKTWLQSELMPKLPSNSVVVLMQPPKVEPVPTPHSTREDMMHWLENRGVPFDADNHRALLYTLIKKTYKKHKEPGLYDEILISSGFQVLKCPSEYQKLDIFKTMTTDCTVHAVTLMRRLSQENWNQLEEKVAEEEKIMMREDEEMGRIIDNLFHSVKNNLISKEMFPEGCCGTQADNFAIHIGDIITD